MLVLGRKVHEKIAISDHIRITVVSIHGNRVRLGVEAPENIKVIRDELFGPGDAGPEAGELTVPRPPMSRGPTSSPSGADRAASLVVGRAFDCRDPHVCARAGGSRLERPVGAPAWVLKNWSGVRCLSVVAGSVWLRGPIFLRPKPRNQATKSH